jgi:hypothetical protein
LSRDRITTAVVTLALLTLPAVPAVAFPGENGKIAFVAGDDLFTIDPDGTNDRNLTNTTGLGVENISASPDGKRIAFNVRDSVLDDAGLYVIDVAGVNFRDVLAGHHDEFIAVGAPAWSPDGSRIAFEAYEYASFSNEMFVVDSDGTGLRRLTDCNCVATTYPVWSPVGPEIAFVPCCSEVVMTINADTLEMTEVFAPESGDINNLTWSPDGTQLAYDDLFDVYRVTVPNGTPVALTTLGPGYYSNPAWSPDGTRILVESNHTFPQSTDRDVYAIDAVEGVTGGVTRITSRLDSEVQPEWAPLCTERCITPSIFLRFEKTKAALKVVGQIIPSAPGRASVTLSRKTPSGFKRVATKTAPFDEHDVFSVSFKRPAKGRCKVEARHPGDAEREPSVRAMTLGC